MKWLLISLGIYLLTCTLMVVFQRRLVYHPFPLFGPVPSDYGTPYEEVFFENASGLHLNGWWVPPPPEAGARAPVVLYFHGNAANLSCLAEVASLFHAHGFGAFLFDYRAYGASEPGPLSEEGLMEDARAARSRLEAEGIPPARIVYWGHSLGSAVAARLTRERPPAALVLEGAFPSLHAVARRIYPWLPVPPSLVQDRFATAEHVRERSFPLLVIHGEEDAIIPLDLGRRTFEAAGEPKEWLSVPGIGHNDLPSVYPSIHGRVRDFLERALRNHTEDRFGVHNGFSSRL